MHLDRGKIRPVFGKGGWTLNVIEAEVDFAINLTDPFGDPLHNIPPTFDPPGGDSWHDPDLNYRDIAWTPEPEVYTGAFGASLVGVGLWLRQRKAHGVTPHVTRPPSSLRASLLASAGGCLRPVAVNPPEI